MYRVYVSEVKKNVVATDDVDSVTKDVAANWQLIASFASKSFMEALQKAYAECAARGNAWRYGGWTLP